MENETQKEIPRFFKPGTAQEVKLMQMFRELPREDKIGYYTFKSKAEGIYLHFYVCQKLLKEKLSKNRVQTNEKTFRSIVVKSIAYATKMPVSQVKDFSEYFHELWID